MRHWVFMYIVLIPPFRIEKNVTFLSLPLRILRRTCNNIYIFVFIFLFISLYNTYIAHNSQINVL